MAFAKFSKHFLADKSTYPLIGALGLAVGFCTFQCVRHLNAPDVKLNPVNRGTLLRANHSEGEAFFNHSLRRFAQNRPTSIMPGLNDVMSK